MPHTRKYFDLLLQQGDIGIALAAASADLEEISDMESDVYEQAASLYQDRNAVVDDRLTGFGIIRWAIEDHIITPQANALPEWKPFMNLCWRFLIRSSTEG